MKKIFYILIIMALASVSCTDNSAVNMAFVKYGHKKGVTSITVPGFVVRFAAKVGDLNREERELLRSIDKVKVLAVEDHQLNIEIDLHGEFYQKMNRNGEYEELFNVRDKDENVTIYGKMDGDEEIRELIVLVGGDENALIYLKGRFNAEMLNKHVKFGYPDNLLSFDFH